jgi:hypothetical protein
MVFGYRIHSRAGGADGMQVHVDGWTDGNAAAEPSLALVMTLSRLVTAAQAAG